MYNLTKEEVLSLSIGLDTDNKEFIESDGLDWFPIFTYRPRTHEYEVQFFRKEQDVYTSDSTCKFRITSGHMYQYVTLKELSTLECGIKANINDLSDETDTTWIPVFIKTPDGLCYNEFLKSINFKNQKFRIDLGDFDNTMSYQNIVDNVNYLMNLTSNEKVQYTIEDLKNKTTIQNIAIVLQTQKFIALSTSPVIEFYKNLKCINRTLNELNKLYQNK